MSEPVSIEALEEALRYRFRDRRLLETSLTHSSFAHEVHQAHQVVTWVGSRRSAWCLSSPRL